MNKLIATKLKYSWNKERITLYQLNQVLTKGVCSFSGKEFDVTKEQLCERLKPEYHQSILEKGYNIIAISDADTFAERLVFAAFKNNLPDATCDYARTVVVVGGQNTMSIYGGDISSMREHEVYIRRLAKLNGYQFDGVVDE